MSDRLLERKKEDYKKKIDLISKSAFNNEQKQIAKEIIESSVESNIDAIYQLISQRLKTGFVFDAAPEVNHNCVSLIKENADKFIDSASNISNYIEHKLRMGENYDALKNLAVTYINPLNGKGLIDVIYIDPPYNTESTKAEGNVYKEKVEGAKFIYRDKFTRDGWLNMINERIKLAYSMLSDDGVMFISIDDYEQAYLKVLCDEVFGEEYTDIMVWRKSGIGRDGKMKNTTTFRKDHEYIIVCYKKNKNLNKSFLKPSFVNEYPNSDDDPRGPYKAGSISRTEEASNPDHKNYYTVKSPSGVEFTRQFDVSYDEFQKLYNDTVLNKHGKEVSRIYWGKNDDAVPSKKIFINEEREVTTSSLLEIEGYVIDDKNMTTTRGSKDFESIIMDRDFSKKMRPKPVELIKRLLQISSSKDSIILDFFAGTGTTGQALMELNEKDKGNRKFILVTNNEANIAYSATWKRLYRVINGKGSNEEMIEWKYSDDLPSLVNNKVRVFDIEHHELTIHDIDKAKVLIKTAERQFKLLNENYNPRNKFDIYNELSALNPFKKD
jgi:adenine-specific DNA-methyltransferase